MPVTVRPANLPAEYSAIAAVLATESPGWSATAEELAYADATRDPAHHHATFAESKAWLCGRRGEFAFCKENIERIRYHRQH